MPKYTVRNDGRGPRVIQVAGGGRRTIPRGAELSDLELDEGTVNAMKGGPLTATPSSGKKKKADDGGGEGSGGGGEGSGGGGNDTKLPVADVLKQADDGTDFQTFKANAAAHLGDNTPPSRDKIVEALKALKEDND